MGSGDLGKNMGGRGLDRHERQLQIFRQAVMRKFLNIGATLIHKTAERGNWPSSRPLNFKPFSRGLTIPSEKRYPRPKRNQGE